MTCTGFPRQMLREGASRGPRPAAPPIVHRSETFPVLAAASARAQAAAHDSDPGLFPNDECFYTCWMQPRFFSTGPVRKLISAYMCFPHIRTDGLVRIFSLTPIPQPWIKLMSVQLHLWVGP